MAESPILVEIGSLAGLELPSLRQRWQELYRTVAPIHLSREILFQSIAYALQEQAYGGLSAAAKAKLQAGKNDVGGKRLQVDRRVKAGTRFLREWQGRTIEVTADDRGGYQFKGRSYRSLSAIAREVTGTRWSGPAFFGLGGRRKHDRDPG